LRSCHWGFEKLSKGSEKPSWVEKLFLAVKLPMDYEKPFPGFRSRYHISNSESCHSKPLDSFFKPGDGFSKSWQKLLKKN
jgi:hypothetical protein